MFAKPSTWPHRRVIGTILRLKALYDRMRARGSAHKAAIIACVGKLISILNAIFKTKTPFDPKRAIR